MHRPMRPTMFVSCLLIAACAGNAPEIREAPSGVNLEVVLQEAGTEPRQPLRYRGVVGQTQRVLLRLSLASFVESRYAFTGAQVPVVELVTQVGQSFTGTEAGTVGYPIRFESIRIDDADGVDEATRAALTSELAPIAKTSAVFEIDDRGITRKASVTVPPEASPRLLALLGNIRTTLLSAALPTEPVGIGARWEVERIMTVGQLKVPQKVTYSLLGREQDRLRIGITVHQSAKPQVLPLGDSGNTLNVESYEVSAVGTTLVDLHSFAPTGEVRGLSQMLATLHHGTADEQFSLNSDLLVQLTPLPTEAPLVGASEAPPAEVPLSTR